MSAPAGWYPTEEGDLRYWDGVQWTAHVAPSSGPVSSPLMTESSSSSGGLAPAGRSAVGVSTWVGWGGLLLVALLGAAISGVSGLFILAALYVFVVAVLALVRGRVSWARLRSRAAGGVALAAAMVLFIVGGATAEPTPATSTSASASSPPPPGSDMTPPPEPTPVERVYRSADAAGYADQRDTADARSLADWAASHGIGALSSSNMDGVDLWLAAVPDYPGDPEVSALVTTAHSQRRAAVDAYSGDDIATADAATKAAMATMVKAQKAMTADFDAALAAAGPSTAYRPADSGASLEVASLARAATVVRWLDGDTVETDQGRVRLVGVDSPEVSDTCSRAEEATANAERLAPAGTVVTLRNPASVQETDRYDRLLRYVEVNGHDVGYSQIREGLGIARYDGADGYDDHPRQAAYRAASQGKPSEDPLCYAAAAAAAAWLLSADNDDHHLWVLTPGQKATTQLLLDADWARAKDLTATQLSEARQDADARIKKAEAKAAAAAKAKAAAKKKAAAAAKAKAAARAKADAAAKKAAAKAKAKAAAADKARKAASSDTGGGGSSSSSNPYPGYTGPRCYAPGGKTWKPC